MIKLQRLLIRNTISNKMLAKIKCSFSTGFNAKIDYYEVLGIKRSATEEDIRGGFRAKVK